MSEIRELLHTVAPPDDWPQVKSPEPGFLLIRHAEMNSQIYWIYDDHGFVCSTSSDEALAAILRIETKFARDPARPFFRRGARDFVYTGWALEHEQHMLRLQSKASGMGLAARQALVRRALQGPKTATTGEGLIKTLGLGDGPIGEE